MNIEISNGELVDKVTILDIKRKKITNPEKLENIKREFSVLSEGLIVIGIDQDSEEYKELIEINSTLWEIEDKIRIKEAKKEFDDEFIHLARSVYFENDRRSEVKRRINMKSGSMLIEEKQYVDYKNVKC